MIFGFFKRNNIFPVLDNTQEESEPKKDKRFFVVIIVFAAAIALTVVRSFFAPTVAEEFHKLRFGVSDGIMLAASAGGYYFLKKRRGDK